MKCVLCRFPRARSELLNAKSMQLKARSGQGLVLAAGIAAGAWKLQALTASGAAAATLVGAAVHAGMGLRGSAAAVVYFASASALGRLPKQGPQVQRRGNRRDAVQVLANGGAPAFFSLVHARSAAPVSDLAASAFYGSLSAAAADTCATEIGTRFGRKPRNIATGRVAASGESGAISLAGLAASVAAATAIALAAKLGTSGRPMQAMSCVAGGVAGSLADSLLGALGQEQRWCQHCGVRTELPVHTCGHRSNYLSGVRSVNNDVVNLLGVTVGGLTAAALASALPHLAGRSGSRVEFATTATISRLPGTSGSL